MFHNTKLKNTSKNYSNFREVLILKCLHCCLLLNSVFFVAINTFSMEVYWLCLLNLSNCTIINFLPRVSKCNVAGFELSELSSHTPMQPSNFKLSHIVLFQWIIFQNSPEKVHQFWSKIFNEGRLHITLYHFVNWKYISKFAHL